MLFLLFDITANLLYIGLAHRESAIPFLPSEPFVFRERLVNPFRRIPLHFPKHVRYGHTGVNRGQQMNMVGCAADSEELPVLILEDAANIVVEARPQFRSELWRSVLGAEDEVVTKASERVTQDGPLRRFCRPSGAQQLGKTHTRGRRPWLPTLALPGRGEQRIARLPGSSYRCFLHTSTSVHDLPSGITRSSVR